METREQMIKNVKKEKALYGCLKELYANSEPKGDFDKLLEESPLDEDGRINIPFMDYEVELDVMTEIIAKYEKTIKPKWRRSGFSPAVLLGCSPKTKQDATKLNALFRTPFLFGRAGDDEQRGNHNQRGYEGVGR